MVLVKDSKNRDMGEREHTCRICGAKGRFKSYLVKEMMKGTGHEFEYFVCPECICLQLADIPDNLGYYYGDDYYSMSDELESDIRFTVPTNHYEKILDVGCGIGKWLYEMAQKGYCNLYGCDPFVENDIKYGDRVDIRKCDITSISGDGSFDIIRMSDSFEHMTNPLEVMKSVHRLLKDGGVAMLSIPTYPNIAFEMFGTYWYQLDAPRHIFLHSLKSLKYLADRCDMRIVNAEYDSNNSQIIRSFFYQNGVTFNDITDELVARYFTAQDIKNADLISEKSNIDGCGDHMLVKLEKNQQVL